MSGRWMCALAVSGALALAGCGTSGGADGDAGTTATTAGASTTTAVPTTEPDPTTTTTTTTVEPAGGLLDCQELLSEYAEAFDPDDMSEVIERFRAWAPDMPAEVGAATERLADAYEAADGDLANVDMMDVDLSADAKTFSDWTNEGCPAG